MIYNDVCSFVIASMVGGALEAVLPVPVCAVITGEIMGALVITCYIDLLLLYTLIQGMLVLGMSIIDKCKPMKVS